MLAGILDPLCKADRYESSVFYEEDVGYSVQVVRSAIGAYAKVLHLSFPGIRSIHGNFVRMTSFVYYDSSILRLL